MRRVAVTGLGLVTPLGIGTRSLRLYLRSQTYASSGVRRTWQRLIESHCGVVSIKDRSPGFAKLPSQVAALVPAGRREDGKWTATEYLSPGVSTLIYIYGVLGLSCSGRTSHGSLCSVCYGRIRRSLG